MTPVLSAEIEKLPSRERLIRIEKALDAAKHGPTWLADARIAQMMCDEIERGDTEFHNYKLHAYVVMPNHIHMLATPAGDIGPMMGKLKGVTARQANLILDRAGQTFWQSRYFDQFSRNQENFAKMQNYVAKNPVWAGLSATPEEFPWSSAHREPGALTHQ
jgi:REP element-mobilizing transposase RayT